MLLGTPPDADLYREPVETTDLGQGLTRVVTAWKGREAAGRPFELLGTCDGFALQLGPGRDPFELEIDRAYDELRRRVHLLWPDGEIDCSNTAAQLLELAQLLRRDEVVAALEEWAAQDRAADAADGEGGAA